MPSDLFETVDELVREYLTFRGFAKTLKSFEMESQRESVMDCKYRVGKLL